MKLRMLIIGFLALNVLLWGPDLVSAKKKKKTATQTVPPEQTDEDATEEGDTDGGEGEESTSLTEQLNAEGGSLQRSNRMEFDERLVKGQVAKSGAVYLFKRVPRELPGLVAMRRSYRNRIVLPVLGARKLKPVTYTKLKDKEEETEAAKTETTEGGEGGSQ